MGSETFSPKLPLIDFSSKDSLTKGSKEWISTRDSVIGALKEYGCFEAIYDNEESKELKDKIYPAISEIFDLPMETKLKYIVTDFIGMDGYGKPSPESPLRESMGIREPIILEKVQSFTDLMWPSTNKSVCETLHLYSKQLAEMDKMVKTMVFEHFGVEKNLDRHIEATSYSLRCTKYKEPTNEEKHVSLRKHVDPGVLTILQQNEVNGLKMQAKDGTWIDVVPSTPSSSFIVLAGYGLMTASAMLDPRKHHVIIYFEFNDVDLTWYGYINNPAWSNGKIHAPLHQVVMEGEKVRYSVGMFTFLDDIIEPPEELLDEEHPTPLFKPFNNLQAMLSFLRASHEKQLLLGVDNQLTSA